VTWIILLVVIASTVWVGIDAKKRDMGPWTWVAGCLLLWLVVLPVYLVRRRNVPLKTSGGDQNSALKPPAVAPALPKVVEPPAAQRAASPAPSLTPAAGSTSGNVISDLERLATLHANGTLDEAEFRAAKSRLLADSPTFPVPPSSAPFPVPPSSVPSAAPATASGFRGAPLAAGAAGVAGGLLLGNVSGASAAPTAGEPISETINYHETFTGPDGEAMTIDGTMESTVTFEDSGDAHVEMHDSGTVDIGGDTSAYESDITGDVDLGGATEEGGGFLSGLFDLF
jgi:Short C-terminal domain